jgi:hypothetical protein
MDQKKAKMYFGLISFQFNCCDFIDAINALIEE